jgi:hypothetical protein
MSTPASAMVSPCLPALIARIVRHKVKEDAARARARKKK